MLIFLLVVCTIFLYLYVALEAGWIKRLMKVIDRHSGYYVMDWYMNFATNIGIEKKEKPEPSRFRTESSLWDDRFNK